MAFVSITRLRLRALRFVPLFALDALRTTAQVRRADGYLTGAILRDRALTFWTMTVWRDAADMKRYIVDGSHLKAMPKLMHWCDEASITHWTTETADLPGWDEADRRMRGEGRPSKVRYPSAGHAALDYRPPRLTGAAPIPPRRG